MDISDGACRVKVAGAADWSSYAAGASFQIPGNSSFEIAVDGDVCQYVCSFH